MKLFGLLLAGINAAGECPSDICWSYNPAAKTCSLIEDSDLCVFTLECKKDGMMVTFPHAMFGTKIGTDLGTDFVDSDGTAEACTSAFTPTDGVDGYKMSTDFSTCGTTVALKDVEGTNMIAFTKSLKFGSGNDAGTSLDSPPVKIYTKGGKSVTVTFECQYSTTATATTALIDIETPVEVQGAVTAATGKFDSGLSIKFMDATWDNENTAAVDIGSTVYPQVSWSVTTLVDKVGFYVKNCNVIDLDLTDLEADAAALAARPAIGVIKDACYAMVVEAKPDSAKFVSQEANFSYLSFSFDTDSTDKQKLSCEIEFCLAPYSAANCAVPISDTCPNDSSLATYLYTPMGVTVSR